MPSAPAPEASARTCGSLCSIIHPPWRSTLVVPGPATRPPCLQSPASLPDRVVLGPGSPAGDLARGRGRAFCGGWPSHTGRPADDLGRRGSPAAGCAVRTGSLATLPHSGGDSTYCGARLVGCWSRGAAELPNPTGLCPGSPRNISAAARGSTAHTGATRLSPARASRALALGSADSAVVEVDSRELPTPFLAWKSGPPLCPGRAGQSPAKACSPASTSTPASALSNSQHAWEEHSPGPLHTRSS
mmetsp:Transcript_51956/g.137451  ORF Transcript_51956/g.137451 Transcript_51956/m.137451 type:complete len:245 (+) Transcript_51956:185-919(+)